MLMELIQTRKPIPKFMQNWIKLTKDGNCLFRTLSYYLYGSEDWQIEIRNQIYEEAKKLKNL